MAILKTAYPNYYKGGNDLEQAANLWAEMFSDDDVRIIAAAVKGFIATDSKGFPPSIGQIKQFAYNLSHEQEMTEQQAWDIVYNAIQNSNYGSVEEFSKLPPIVQDAVGSPRQLKEWAAIDTDRVQTVIASNFQRSYRVRSENFRKFNALPHDVKELAKTFGTKMGLNRLLESDEREEE